jgi:diguanylate cyclase (GGDEF)-like protein
LKILNKIFPYNANAYLEYTQNLVVLIDQQGRLIEWNPAFAKIKTAVPSAKSIQEIITDPCRCQIEEKLECAGPSHLGIQFLPAAGGNTYNCFLAPTPEKYWLFHAESDRQQRDEDLARMADELVKIRRALKIKEIELEAVLVQADEVSHTDALTFLVNRKGILADLQREIARSDRYRKPLTIFMLDLDHFKPINDTFGHSVGDQVLQKLTGEMYTCIRQIDKLGRFGGDEFLLILPTTSKNKSIVIADRLINSIRSQHLTIEGHPIPPLSVSIGIAQYSRSKESWQDLINRADKALYEAKTTGRDRWVFSTSPK